MMKLFKKLMSIAVLFIGAYMMTKHWASATPPFLSGIAFTLLGLNHLIETLCCQKKKWLERLFSK